MLESALPRMEPRRHQHRGRHPAREGVRQEPELGAARRGDAAAASCARTRRTSTRTTSSGCSTRPAASPPAPRRCSAACSSCGPGTRRPPPSSDPDGRRTPRRRPAQAPVRPGQGFVSSAQGRGLPAARARRSSSPSVALGAPRFTWENDGRARCGIPPHRRPRLLGAAARSGRGGLRLARRAARWRCGLAAAALVGLSAAQRLAWRVEAVEAGVQRADSSPAATRASLERDRARRARASDAVTLRARSGTAARDRHRAASRPTERVRLSARSPGASGSRDQMNRCSSSSPWPRRRAPGRAAVRRT